MYRPAPAGAHYHTKRSRYGIFGYAIPARRTSTGPVETHRGGRRHYHTKHCHATVLTLGRFYCDTSQAKFSFDTEQDTGPAYTHPEISTSDKTHRRLVSPEIPSVLRVCQYPYGVRRVLYRWVRTTKQLRPLKVVSGFGCRLGKPPKRSAAELRTATPAPRRCTAAPVRLCRPLAWCPCTKTRCGLRSSRLFTRVVPVRVGGRPVGVRVASVGSG